MRKAEQEEEERKARRAREKADLRERNAVFAILGRLADKLALTYTSWVFLCVGFFLFVFLSVFSILYGNTCDFSVVVACSPISCLAR